MGQGQGAKPRHHDAWLPAAVREVGIDRSLKAGEFLFRVDAPIVGLFEVIKGKVKLVRVDAAGRETILYVASPGDTVAEASLFSRTYHCDAVAMSDAVARLYPKSALLAAFNQSPRDRKSTRLNSSHVSESRMPSSA